MYQVNTSIGDCDGWPLGDSDPTWWWTGPGVVDDQCYQTTCNGCTRSISESLMNENYDCALDVPGTISVSFNGCEDDGPTGCVGGFAGSIICDGSSGSRTDNIGINSTNGTYWLGPYCVNASGCSGQYCYWARMDVSGNFTVSSGNNDICSYYHMGTLNVGGSLFRNNDNNLCSDTQGGEPNASGGDETVWYRFTTGGTIGNDVTISFDGSGNGDNVTGYIALYEVNPSTSCSFGNLSFIDDASQLVPFVYDVSMTVPCLDPNTTYFVQVDGIDGLNDVGIFDLTISSSTQAANPANDICNYTSMGTFNLGGNLFLNNENNFCADQQSGEPNVNGGDESVWYQFTTGATIGSEFYIDFDGSGNGDEITGYVALYEVVPSSSCAFGNLNFVDDATQIIPFIYDVTLTIECLDPNTTYFIQVDGVDGLNDEGIFDLRVTDNNIVRAPNNDICDYIHLGTLNLGGNLSINNQNNFCADQQSGEPNVNGGDESVWFRFTTGASVASNVIIDFDGSGNGDNITGYLALYEVNPSTSCSFGNLGFVDDATQLIPFIYDVTLTAECIDANTTYFVQVDGVDNLNDQGIFDLNISDNGVPKPLNNDMCDATNLGTLSLGSNIYLPLESNFCSDIEPGEPLPSGGLIHTDNTVWYEFTTDATIGQIGYEVVLDASGIPTFFFTVLHIYEDSDGNCATLNDLVELQNFDEIGGVVDPDISNRTVRCLQPNTKYYIQIDGIFGSLPDAEDQFTLSVIDNNLVRALNDDKCDAMYLGRIPDNDSVVIANANNYCAGVEPGEYGGVNWGDGLINPNDPEQTIWYSFKAPSSESVEIILDNDITPPTDNINLELAVWETSTNDCLGFFGEKESGDPLTSMSLKGGNSLKVTCLDTTKTYFIQIDGDNTILLEELRMGHFSMRIKDYLSPPAPHDLICDAIYLGDPTGGQVGLQQETNFCANNILEPIPSGFQTDMTVWYTFTAPASGRVHIFTDDVDAPTGNPDDIDLQVAVFGTDNQADPCMGNLFEVRSEYQVGDLTYPLDLDILTNDEYLRDVICLIPGHTYFIMVDGEAFVLGTVDDLDGYFDIQIDDMGGPAASPNDSICGYVDMGSAPVAVGGSITVTPYNNECATAAGEPVPISWTPDNTLWFSFIAPATGHIQIDLHSDVLNATYPDLVDLQVAVYGSDDSTCSGILGEVISDYDPIFFDETVDVQCLNPGERYFIQVDGNANIPLLDALGYGWFDVEVTTMAQTPQAVNDNLCDATSLGQVNSSGSFTLLQETNRCTSEELGEPNVSGNPNPYSLFYDETVWYEFTTGATPGDITIDIYSIIQLPPNTFINAGINVYESPIGSTCSFSDLYEIGAAFNPIWPIPNIGSEDLTITCLKPNTTYYIQIDGLDLFWEEEGEFDITISDNGVPNMPPANDNVCGATFMGVVLSGSSVTLNNQDNFCAGEDPGEPNVSGGNNTQAVGYDETVWYTFNTGVNPGTFTIDVTNVSGIDATIAAYSGVPGCGTPLSNYSGMTLIDEVFNPVPLNSSISLTLPCLYPNSRYYIQIDGLDGLGDEGVFNIAITDNGFISNFPVNDNICNASTMGVVPSGSSVSLTNQNNFCTTEEVGEPNVSGGTIVSAPGYDETVWYIFTTSNTPGAITVDVTNFTGIDPIITVYDISFAPSCAFIDLTEIAQSGLFNQSVGIRCARPNTSYYIQIDGVDITGDKGTFDISVTDNGIANLYPANDNICNALNFGLMPVFGTVNATNQHNFCATEETGEPNVSGLNNFLDQNYDETVWYSYFTNLTPGDIRISVTNTSGAWDPMILVYEVNPSGSCDFNDLHFRAASSIFNTGDVSLTINCDKINTQYAVQIDGIDVNGDDQGSFNISVEHLASTAGPLYDNVCDAQTVTLGVAEPGANFCAGEQPNEPNVSGTGNVSSINYDETVWYAFYGPPSGEVNIDIDSDGAIDVNFNLYYAANSNCVFSQLIQVGGNYDNFIPSFPFDPFAFDVNETITCIVNGGLYLVQVDGGDLTGDHGTFDITVTDANPGYVPPAHDECSGAIDLTAYISDRSCQSGNGPPWIDTGTPVNTLYGDPTISIVNAFTLNCGDNCGDVWFRFTTPPNNSGTMLIEGNDEYGIAGATNSNLTINAWVGGCGSLVPLQCSNGGIGNDPYFYLQVNPAGGQTVFLQVYNQDINSILNPFGINGDEYGLCITDRCGSDDCLTATVMELDSVYCWDTQGAQGEDIGSGTPGYIECGNGVDPDNSLYFQFTTDSCGGRYEVNLTGIIGGACLISIPTDGLSIAIYEDATPCDNNPDALLDCQQTDICDGQYYLFQQQYSLHPNTLYIIQLDGFDPFFGGGDNEGDIWINKILPTPSFMADTVCIGQLTTFTDLSNPQGQIIEWIWEYGDGSANDTFYSPTNPTHLYLFDGTYTATLYVKNDAYNICYDTLTTDVLILPGSGTFDAGPDTAVCPGSTVTLIATGGASVKWLPGGQTTSSITVTPTTTTTYIAIDTIGCTGSDSVRIDLTQLVLNFDTTDEVCVGVENGMVKATASGGDGNYSYVWSNGMVGDSIGGLVAGTYVVTATDAAGCSGVDSAVVNLAIPSGSTGLWTWTGVVDSNWFEACNWDKLTVPNPLSLVLIPGMTPDNPVIFVDTAYCDEIEINTTNGAHLRIDITSGGAFIDGP